jgi:hypothetical protein
MLGFYLDQATGYPAWRTSRSSSLPPENKGQDLAEATAASFQIPYNLLFINHPTMSPFDTDTVVKYNLHRLILSSWHITIK